MNRHSVFLSCLLLLLGAWHSVQAAHVTITMNSVTQTMTLKNEDGDVIPEDGLSGRTYEFNSLSNGDYTIYGYHKKVSKYTKILWQLEMISSNPYAHVKFPRGKNKERNPLIEEELLKMRNAKYTGHIERARDLFVFMAYTGLAYCDMAAFNFDTMTEKHQDYTYIDGSRLKTGSNFFTPILPPAMEVLKKYNYKLPLISNQKANDYMHVMEADLHINKPISCHIARHSFATLMLSYNIPIEKVKRMLGHKNIATTQIYAKILKKNVEESVTENLHILK